MPVERSTRLKQTTLDGKQAQAKVHSSSTKSRKKRVSDTSNERVFTDVLLTIKPEFAKTILKRDKNYEFRNYQLRPTVERLWLYESAPTSAITYVIETSKPKVQGEVCDPTGVGNDDFDAGKHSKYAYPVLGLWRLRAPVTSRMLKDRFAISVPQSFCFATQNLVDSEKVDDMEKIF